MWFLKENFILRDKHSEGGGNPVMDFSTSFTEEDTDNFDLSSLDKSNQKSEEDIALENEAKEAGVSIDELKTQKEKTIEMENDLADEAKEKDISIEDLKLEKEIEAESEKTGKSIDEVKKEKSAENEKVKQEKVDKKEIEDLKTKLKEEGKSDKDIETEVKNKEKEIEDRNNDADINPFAGYKPSEENKDVDKIEKVDYNELAEDVGYEVEDGIKIESMDQFKEIAKSNLEKAKQTIDTSVLTPEAKMLFDNFQKNKSLQITDFYRNDKIRQIDNFANSSDESKVKSLLSQELEKITSPDDLKDAVEDKFATMTEDEVSTKVREINRELTKRKTLEFNNIIKEKNEFFEQQAQAEEKTAEAERKSLISKVEKMTEYMGFPVPKEAVNGMIKEIESQAFQKYLDENVEEAKINAYIGTKFGKQFKKSYEQIMAITRTDAYKKGLEVNKKQKHNISSGGQQIKSNRTTGDLSFSNDHFKEE